MWELSHAHLLSNEACWRRGLALSLNCIHCQGMVEDFLHALWDWAESKEVWHHVLPPSFLQKFFSLLLRKWLEWNLLCKELSAFGLSDLL